MRTYLYSNLKYLLKHCGNYNLGDLEASVGVSTGYFSKVAKRDGEETISFRTVIKLAKELNVDMEELMYKDFAREGKMNALKVGIESLQNELDKMEREKGEE